MPPMVSLRFDDRRAFRFIASLLVLNVIVRALVTFFIVPTWEAGANVAPAPDAYPVLARQLHQFGELGFGIHGASPTSLRGPMFPLWLAAGIHVLGDDVRWLAFWGSLPSAVIVALVAGLAYRRWGCLPGIACAAVGGLHPLPLWVAGRVMSDDFHGALAVGAIVCAALIQDEASERRRMLLGIGLFVFLSAHLLTRSAGLLTLVAIALCIAARSFRRPGVTVVLLLFALLPALGWSVRTSLLEGRPVFVHSLTWYNFWLAESWYRRGAVETRGDATRAEHALILHHAGLPPERVESFWWGQLAPREVASLERNLARAAFEHVQTNPVAYAHRVARGTLLFWCGAETRARIRHYVIAVAPVLLLAGVGAVRNRRDPLVLACILVVLLHWFAYAAIAPRARYSVAVYPALAILAAAGVHFLLTKSRARRRTADPRLDAPGGAS